MNILTARLYFTPHASPHPQPVQRTFSKFLTVGCSGLKIAPINCRPTPGSRLRCFRLGAPLKIWPVSCKIVDGNWDARTMNNTYCRTNDCDGIMIQMIVTNVNCLFVVNITTTISVDPRHRLPALYVWEYSQTLLSCLGSFSTHSAIVAHTPIPRKRAYR